MSIIGGELFVWNLSGYEKGGGCEEGEMWERIGEKGNREGKGLGKRVFSVSKTLFFYEELKPGDRIFRGYDKGQFKKLIAVNIDL